MVDVDPDAKRFTVYVWGDRRKPLWSFDRAGSLDKVFLSNDGKVVAILHWRYVTEDSLPRAICLEFWGEKGLIRDYTFGEICPHPARTNNNGPQGKFWRTWYSRAESDGEQLSLRTTGLYNYSFSLVDGAILEQSRWDLPLWIGAGVMAGIAALVAAVWFLKRRRRSDPEIDAASP